MNQLINILIRTSDRPELFSRCLQSVRSQEYDNIRIIVSYDKATALDYLPEEIEKIPVCNPSQRPFFYNLYCNDLKAEVKEGYFMFLDDDDYLIRGSLQKISPYLTGPGIIFPFLRNGWNRPSHRCFTQRSIEKGRIGMPCFILSNQIKDLYNFTASESADYEFIKEISGKVNLNWVEIPVVYSEKRRFGL